MVEKNEQNSVSSKSENGDLNLATEQVIVKKSTTFYDQNSDAFLKSYSTRSKNRGLLFLVNNHNLLSSDQMRKKSDIDYDNLISLFQEMHFQVEHFENLTLTGMREELRNMRQHADLSKFDCFFAIIMSYSENCGSSKIMNVVTSDNQTIQISEIIGNFTSSSCPELAKKPKVFIFQLCKEDDDVLKDSLLRNTLNADPNSFEKIAHNPDLLIYNSILPRFLPRNDVSTGTWCMQTICDVFMNHAHNKDIELLLQVVSQRVESIRYKRNIDITTNAVNVCFKTLFLHPGIYEEDGERKTF